MCFVPYGRYCSGMLFKSLGNESLSRIQEVKQNSVNVRHRDRAMMDSEEYSEKHRAIMKADLEMLPLGSCNRDVCISALKKLNSL